DTGEPVADGEPGELLFTSLTKEAMTVIRYRTRDLTRLLPPTSRSMRRLRTITGRSLDRLIESGVNLFPTRVEEQVLKSAQLASHYQLVLTREGLLDQLEILTEVRDEFAHLGESEREALAGQLQHAVKSYIGVTARVRVAAGGFVE